MNQDQLVIIREIEEAAHSSEKIPASQIKAWLSHPSLQVLGAVTCHILRHSRRVEPPLSMEEMCTAIQSYYRECLIQNLERTDYVPNRHIAGYEFVGWFKSLWRDPAVPRQYLSRLKTMLRDLCVQDKVPREEIVTAVLEHLFEIPEIIKFFADWKSDPFLGAAFAEAMEWIEKPSQ